MDPDALLAAIREEMAELVEDGDAEAFGLVEKVQALDEWLTKGGFLPRDWSAGRP